MPSQNVLLGSGVQEEKPITEHIETTHLRTPAWRFHKDFPNRLCKTDAELDKLDAEGWLDHPGKVRLLPGHEKVWEAYQKSLEVGKVSEVKEEVVVEAVKTEDQIRADALKAESDKVEARRLDDERKAEEKRLKDEKKEEEKRLKEEQKAEIKNLEPEPKSEETIQKEYEEAKIPPGPRLCTLCGMVFDSKDYADPLLALNKHQKRMHKGKRRNHKL